MNARMFAVAIAAATTATLTACGSSHDASGPARSSTHAAAMTPGMVMPDGSTMGAEATDTARKPSAAAQMICNAETHDSIKEILGLATTPRSISSWAHQLFTCTYRLPQGLLVITVKESPTPVAARTHAAAQRAGSGAAQPVAGLTPFAYGTAGGKIVLVKDNDTLTVDATALPPIVGGQQAKRYDFAYELASAILGCWTGDDGT